MTRSAGLRRKARAMPPRGQQAAELGIRTADRLIGGRQSAEPHEVAVRRAQRSRRSKPRARSSSNHGRNSAAAIRSLSASVSAGSAKSSQYRVTTGSRIESATKSAQSRSRSNGVRTRRAVTSRHRVVVLAVSRGVSRAAPGWWARYSRKSSLVTTPAGRSPRTATGRTRRRTGARTPRRAWRTPRPGAAADP